MVIHTRTRTQTRARAALFALYFALLLFLGHWCLTYLPNTGDEHSILFQAKIFARFRAWAPAPPLPEFFHSHALAMYDGRWFSICPPFFALLYVPGVWLGYPLLGSALISCATLFLLERFLRKLGTSALDAALLTALFALSPTFLFQSISFYTHLGTQLMLLVALNQFGDDWRAPSGPRLERPGLLGATLGLGFGIRTWTTVLLALPIFVYLLLRWRRGTLARNPLLRVVSGGGGALLLVLLLNQAINGSYAADFHFIENVQYRFARTDFPYGWDAVLRIRDMLADGLRWVYGRGPWDWRNLKFPESGAFPWGLSLFVGGFALAISRWVRARTTLARAGVGLLLALAATLIVGHFSFDNSVAGRFGERYFFETHFIWLLFTWMFLSWALARGLKRATKQVGAEAFVLLLIPMLLGDVSTARYFHDENPQRMDLFLRTAALGPGARVVFIRDTPEFDPPWYSRNEPDLSGTIFVADLGDARDRELLAAFPGRPAFVYRKSDAGAWELARYN